MSHRTWMYSGWQRGKAPSNEWIDETTQFLNHAFSIPGVAENDTIKCPCAMCRNYFRHKRNTVELHLCKHGFREGYEKWIEHGEMPVRNEECDNTTHGEGFDDTDQMEQMLVDLTGGLPPAIDDEPAAYANAFYRMVASADERVHDNTTHSSLSAIARLLAIKSRYNMSIAEYDDILGIIHELLPPDSKLPNDFYHSKKMLEGLGMLYVKIDVCVNNCMLFYKENQNKEKCDFCNENRYEEGRSKVPRKVLRYLPITDRLQRLYAHEQTAKLMRSHRPLTNGKMVHPCDGEAWQDFDDHFPDFARDRRNVRLAVATDGFQPFDNVSATYSCWPVFVTPLNLPPGTLLRPEYIFLALVVPGPDHPGKKLNILMQPLVDEFEKHVRPSNPVSLQNMARENAQLRRENAMLRQERRENARQHEQNQVTTELLLDLYRNLGKEIPAAALQRLSSSEANVTSSSHIGLESTNDDNNNSPSGHGCEHLGAENNNSPSGHGSEHLGIENNNSPSGNHASL